MDNQYLLEVMDAIANTEQGELFELAANDFLASDEMRLAAALLLCTCDSNERKAGE